MDNTTFFHQFENDIQYELPKKFTYPFYYEPHPIALLAVEQLQKYLQNQSDFQHTFFQNDTRETPIGKMFGVLVVKNSKGKLGHLWAVSGKLAGTNIHKHFVPPVYDMLNPDSYFLNEEICLNEINAKIESFENSKTFQFAQNSYLETKSYFEKELEELRLEIIESRKNRKAKRKQAEQELNSEELANLLKSLSEESVRQKLQQRGLKQLAEEKINQSKVAYEKLNAEILQLKNERKLKSNQLQKWLFEQYDFLNIEGATKNLLDIFKETPLKTPPAAAGECAAPKLLQYAFANDLTPIAMAEFWWGDAPNTEIRKHKHFYPACQGKCKPILGHMLQGMELDKNPLLENPAIGKELTTIFEDEHLLVIEKPAEFLSAPGKVIQDSVATRMKHKYPEATGPMIVHRLDMSTSGLMLIAKSESIYKQLQEQFIKRTVKKRYTALLDGTISQSKGEINLPIRLDIDDRPRQMVCYKHGKNAVTQYEVVETKNNKTRVHLYPITGRTHQLRVHCAHPKGLNTSIVGDDLYGQKANRLHLHATEIHFTHPVTKERVSFIKEAEF